MATASEILEHAKQAAHIELMIELAQSFKITDASINKQYCFKKQPKTVPVADVNLVIDWQLIKQENKTSTPSTPVGSSETIDNMGVCLGYFFELEANTNQDDLYKKTQTEADYKADKLTRLDATLTAITELTALVQAEKVNIEAGEISQLKEIKPLIEYAKTLKTYATE